MMACLLLSCTHSVWAGAKEQAQLLFQRINRVPPSQAILDQLTPLVLAKQWKAASQIAMSSPSFYNVALKNWIAPWTNTDQQSIVPLNDYTATIIGMIRDDIPFDQVLYGDHLYMASPTLVSSGQVSAWSASNNSHYRDIEDSGVDLSLPQNLIHVSQSTLTGIPDTAGIITTRASGQAYFSAGTNRRMFRSIAINFLCRDLELLQDASLSDIRVRRDVDRSPGGDSRVYKNRCVSCHALQDGVGGAFAYFDFSNNAVQYSLSKVQGKYNKNGGTFPGGYVTTDDSWINFMVQGLDTSLGWRTSSSATKFDSGNGARALGKAIASTSAFSSCTVEKVFNQLCLRAPTVSERQGFDAISKDFELNNYNLKTVFTEVIPLCVGN